MTDQDSEPAPDGAADRATHEPVAPGDRPFGDEWEASDEAQFRAVEATLEAEGLRREVDGLRHALESHPVIDMARGLVMATGRCTPDDAWRVLVEVSQHTNIKLRAIAQALVDGVEGPPPAPQVREALNASFRRLAEERRQEQASGERHHDRPAEEPREEQRSEREEQRSEEGRRNLP
ncbi:ANTAR domain-containing protein [Streptomyces fuscigenes]|uniref:ANTAR domain-containing protein n=1 Tax=Streptomyces fuscigenes TaxID=1528880 RepID=UPI001F34ED08|nr:ANTAR domain-containing protein [Streptomyces fuscigenes]MCF3961984.1 ANTAR domain-containing protein [Streptomyces fuscigenes]